VNFFELIFKNSGNTSLFHYMHKLVLTLFRKIIAVYSENYERQSAGVFNLKTCGAYSNHYALNG
jgi:hypothetical protein